MKYRFPFGVEVLERNVHAPNVCKAFILGAYPSALHVRWVPPGEYRDVSALPVDNEPLPFWDGAGEGDLIENWQKEVGFSVKWGRIGPVGRLNGSSGAWVEDNVLDVLSFSRDEVWITDCLPDYRSSVNVRARIEDTYSVFARQVGLPEACLKAHPTEGEIVAEATKHHSRQTRERLVDAQPPLIITLGNAALRFIRSISTSERGIPYRLDRKAPYGVKIEIQVAGVGAVTLLALAHPASPPAYQELHRDWAKRMRSK